MSQNNENLAEWMGFKSKLDYRNHPKLGALLGWSLSLLAIFLFLIALGILFHLASSVFAPAENSMVGEDIRNLGLAVAAIIGVPFLIWRSLVAQKQVNVSEQGQITDRINKAVEGLGAEKLIKRQRRNSNGSLLYDIKEGSDDPDFKKPIMEEISEPNLEVRIGSIFALERISRDSQRDHIQIMEILCAYIRENAKCDELKISGELHRRPSVRSDIQTAIRVLGRRSPEAKKIEREQKFRLDLSRTNLSGANFTGLDFSGAVFVECKIEAALFGNTNLNGSFLNHSILNYSRFMNASLVGACLDCVKINYPHPSNGGMSDSINFADLTGARMCGADLSALDYLGQAQEQSVTFGSSDTKLTLELDERRDTAQSDVKKMKKFQRTRNQEKAAEYEQKARQSGFFYWVPFQRNDLAISHYYGKFQQELGLTDFPYRE